MPRSRAAGCTVQGVSDRQGRRAHRRDRPDPPSWDSDPPTHGPHDPVWAIWGQYDTEVAQRNLVHNLEHAGLVIQYGPNVPADQLAALKKAVLEDTEWTVLAPYAKLNDNIAFELWGKLTQCKKFDQAVLDRFRSYRNKPGGSAESDQFPDGRDWSQEERQPGWYAAALLERGEPARGGPRSPRGFWQDDERAGRARAPPARSGRLSSGSGRACTGPRPARRCTRPARA